MIAIYLFDKTQQIYKTVILFMPAQGCKYHVMFCAIKWTLEPERLKKLQKNCFEDLFDLIIVVLYHEKPASRK